MTKSEALQKIEELKLFIQEQDDIFIDMVEIRNLASHDFAIGRYPVTQQEWVSIMGKNSSYNQTEYTLNHPVENVSWEDTQEFIKKLNIRTGENYRLPTEYEWLVCATIDGTLYSGSNDLNEVGWYNGNCKCTQAVGLKKPNSLGIYDMSGNVAEWCEDLYSINSLYRVCRGGSWNFVAVNCRSATRLRVTSDFRGDILGFRVVKTL
jgi:formylglycine-generating enzyme required for sulfatase activity